MYHHLIVYISLHHTPPLLHIWQHCLNHCHPTRISLTSARRYTFLRWYPPTFAHSFPPRFFSLFPLKTENYRHNTSSTENRSAIMVDEENVEGGGGERDRRGQSETYLTIRKLFGKIRWKTFLIWLLSNKGGLYEKGKNV